MITQAQFYGALKWVLAIAGPTLIATGWIPATVWDTIAAAALSLVPLLWGWLVTHTTSGILASAEALPGVQSILIKPTASPAALDAVADTSRPKVIMAPSNLGGRK